MDHGKDLYAVFQIDPERVTGFIQEGRLAGTWFTIKLPSDILTIRVPLQFVTVETRTPVFTTAVAVTVLEAIVVVETTGETVDCEPLVHPTIFFSTLRTSNRATHVRTICVPLQFVTTSISVVAYD